MAKRQVKEISPSYKHALEMLKKLESNTIKAVKTEAKVRYINFNHTCIFTIENGKYYLEMISTDHYTGKDKTNKVDIHPRLWMTDFLSICDYHADKYIITEIV